MQPLPQIHRPPLIESRDTQVSALVRHNTAIREHRTESRLQDSIQRQLRALQLLRETGEGPETVPVLLTDDIVQARAWAMTENVGRIDLNPADEADKLAAQNPDQRFDVLRVWASVIVHSNPTAA